MTSHVTHLESALDGTRLPAQRLQTTQLGQGSRRELMRSVITLLKDCERLVVVTRFDSAEVNELLPQLVRLARKVPQ